MSHPKIALFTGVTSVTSVTSREGADLSALQLNNR